MTSSGKPLIEVFDALFAEEKRQREESESRERARLREAGVDVLADFRAKRQLA